MKKLTTASAWTSILVAAFIFLFPGCWNTDRPQSKEEATHIFSGVVESLEEENAPSARFYNCRIKVESIEKGDGIKVGDEIEIRTYVDLPPLQQRLTPTKLPAPPRLPPSYESPPIANQRIKVYAIRNGAGYSALRPAWYEKL